MSRKNPSSAFFVPIDGALFNDLGEGKVTPNMWCVYSMILRQVNFETGIWHGSAYRICDGWAWQIPQRTAQDSLKKLCAAGYLKSFHLRGSRNDYAVAVHGYPIRFGKWKGYRLNAAATTDPFSPVYEECGQDEITVSAQDQRNVSAASPQAPRSVSAASPQAPRSVSAASAQDQRSVPAASAYPNARNTPDVPEYPDVPYAEEGVEGPDSKDNTQKEPALASLRATVVGNADGDASAAPLSQTGASRQRQWEKPELLAAFREIYECHTGRRFDATKTHIDAVAELVAQSRSSYDMVLAAFEEWCRCNPAEMFTAQVEGGKTQDIAWPLQKFVSQGYAKEYIDQVRPFTHLMTYRGPTLQIILDADDPTVTDAQAAALRELINAHGFDMMRSAVSEAQSIRRFLQAPMQFIQAAYLHNIAWELGAVPGKLTLETKAAALDFAKAAGGYKSALEMIDDADEWRGRSQDDFVAFCRANMAAATQVAAQVA